MDPRVLVCVGATFCSKTGMFFSCACSKPSGVHVCPRQSRPHSAAKQSRFFRLAALNFALHREICKTVADFGLPNSVHETCILIKARCQAFLFLFVWLLLTAFPSSNSPHGRKSAAKQGRSFRVAALNWVLNLGSKNGPSSARVCPKGSGPHSAAKQGRSFRVPALKLPGSLYAQGGRSHILRQNRAVLFVWLL